MNARNPIEGHDGLQDDGRSDTWNYATHAVDRAEADGVGTALDELAAAHERIDWRDVPGVTAAEAGAWVARLTEAADSSGGQE